MCHLINEFMTHKSNWGSESLISISLFLHCLVLLRHACNDMARRPLLGMFPLILDFPDSRSVHNKSAFFMDHSVSKIVLPPIWRFALLTDFIISFHVCIQPESSSQKLLEVFSSGLDQQCYQQLRHQQYCLSYKQNLRWVSLKRSLTYIQKVLKLSNFIISPMEAFYTFHFFNRLHGLI